MYNKKFMIYIDKKLDKSDEYILEHLYKNNKDEFLINECGAIILKHCNGSNTIEDICEILSGIYEIEDKTLLTIDIESFLLELTNLDLVTPI